MSDLNQELISTEAGHRCLSLGRIGRRLALLLTFCAVLIFHGTLSSATERPQLVRVGIFQNRPIVFQDEHGLPQGLYVDLLHKIAQEEDWEIEFVPGSWGEGLKRLRSGEIDLMTSIAYTKERDEHMDFSSENVLMMWGQVYVKPDSDTQNILDLKGQKIAILKDGINGINFRKLCIGFGVNCQFVVVDTYAKVFELVAEGKVGAGVANNVHGDILARQYGVQRSPILFNPFSLLFAVPERKHRDLLSTIDKRLIAWKGNESSFYYETLNHWFGMMSISKYSIPRWVIFTLIISGGLALLFLICMYVLQIQVKARTREIRLSEEALRESEERLRSLVNSSPDLVFLFDQEGYYLEVLTSQNQLLVEDVGDLIGKRVTDVLPDRLAKLFLEALNRTIESGDNDIVEYELDVPAGHRWFEGRLAPISGRIDGKRTVLFVSRDITERKQVMEELRLERDNLIRIFEAMEDGVYIVNQQYDIQYVNTVLEKDFGPHEDRKCYEYFHDRKEVCPWCKNQDVFAGKTVHWEWFSFKNQKTYDLIDTPVRNPDGTISKLEIFRDITERKRAEEELEKHRQHLEKLVKERTAELQKIVNLMAGREVRMADLKKVIKKLREQIESAGLTPVADDPLKEMSEG